MKTRRRDPPVAIELRLLTPDCPGRRVAAEPVTVGVPLPRGAVRGVGGLGLRDDESADVPLQAVPTEWWPDGSIRWVLLDFQVTGVPVPTRCYVVDLDRADRPSQSARVSAVEHAGRVTVETGAGRFEIGSSPGFPLSSATIGGVERLGAARTAVIVTDAAGRSWPVEVVRVAVEDGGDLRTVVRLDGIVGDRRRPIVEVIARLHFFAGSAAIRVALTLRNPRRAAHPGGFWELGDRGSVYMRDASLHVAARSEIHGVECTRELDAPFETFGVPFELYQDSSGGENWGSLTHVDRDGAVPCTFRGNRLRAPGRRHEGLRATPSIVAGDGADSVRIAVEHFWQNFPRAIEADADALVLRLWPRQFAALHELQGGEQKTHRFTLAFGDDAMARDTVFWGRAPSIAAAQPRWYADAAAVPYLAPAAEHPDRRYQQLVDSAVDGPHAFARKRETIDEYGWRNFGDLYADHENVYAAEPPPIVSHYNNQYDAIHGFAVQFMRTGDLRWWRSMTELAAHVSDIDIYHTDEDKAAYNHGLFWHTSHYAPAGLCGHRSYPRHPRVGGGGSSSEHNYASGLRLHWLLTGERHARDAALELAQWVIDMDDGRKTVFRWLSTAYTGLASATASPGYHGPGRGAGHSILALIDGHRLTGDARFLAKAEHLIARCIHPADDIAALHLLDAERRWSYTAFLQALGKYLGYKTELGEIDAAYAYGRQALLHYARWMAEHEYPYLEKPEILDYPTETWAAQDMRKFEVFAVAGGHAGDEERRRFVERAGFFFDASVSTLINAETRSLTRPVVLLLSNGYGHDHSVPIERPQPDVSGAHFGSPARFVPQKAIAKRRLLALCAATAVIGLLLLIAGACHILS